MEDKDDQMDQVDQVDQVSVASAGGGDDAVECAAVEDIESGSRNNNNNNKDNKEHHDEEAALTDLLRRRKLTLFDEVLNALNSAFLMFCLPDLKALATAGILQGDPDTIQRIIDMPVTLYEVMTIYHHNKQRLTEERLKCEDRADMYEAALTMTRYDEIQTEQDRQTVLNQVELFVLDDVHENEECVYAISRNNLSRHITVAFRGSVTSKDFKQDAKALLSYIPNPIRKASPAATNDNQQDDLPPQVGLHLGFKEYLYGTHKERTTEPDRIPKYKLILDKAAELMLDENYTLRIVGHSLGGALTTVLALEAAGDDRFPSPITAITSGAPKVGNLEFLQTFEYLERTGRVRCLQVANNKDPVTQSPPIGNFDPCGPIFCRHRIFRHVGLRLHLNPKGFVIWHPMKAKSYPGILVFDWIYVATNCGIFCGGLLLLMCCFNVFALLALPVCCCCAYAFMKTSRQHHTQLKYIHRLEFSKAELEQLLLDELNEIRFGRSPYRLSRTLVSHKSSSCKLFRDGTNKNKTNDGSGDINDSNNNNTKGEDQKQ